MLTGFTDDNGAHSRLSATAAPRGDAPNSVATERKTAKVLLHGAVLDIHYAVWNGPSEPLGTLFCTHAMLRNHFDFVALARNLARYFRVIAIDLPGHGFSGWLPDKTAYRGRDVHLQAAGQVLLREATPPLIYLGTSLGGLVGLQLAAAAGSPIDFLILNDIAPETNPAAKRRFLRILNAKIAFRDRAEAERFLEQYVGVSHSIGPADREAMIQANLRRERDGRWRLNHDPDIREAYRDGAGAVSQDHWHLWDEVKCPVLLLRAAENSFVEGATVNRMRRSHADLVVVDIPDSSHPPDLSTPLESSVILNWFRERQAQRPAT